MRNSTWRPKGHDLTYVQVTKMLVEALWWDFRTQQSEVKAQAGRGGGVNTVTGTDRVKQPKFDRSMS
jgi:hypothetical protein